MQAIEILEENTNTIPHEHKRTKKLQPYDGNRSSFYTELTLPKEQDNSCTLTVIGSQETARDTEVTASDDAVQSRSRY